MATAARRVATAATEAGYPANRGIVMPTAAFSSGVPPRSAIIGIPRIVRDTERRQPRLGYR
jgi:hypothetical protein